MYDHQWNNIDTSVAVAPGVTPKVSAKLLRVLSANSRAIVSLSPRRLRPSDFDSPDCQHRLARIGIRVYLGTQVR